MNKGNSNHIFIREIKAEDLEAIVSLFRETVHNVNAKVDIDAQKKFHDEALQPRLEEAKAGKRAVYFVDAAHFVMGAFLGFLWCVTYK